MSPTDPLLIHEQILRVLGEHHRAQHRSLNLPYLLTARLEQFLHQQSLIQMAVRSATRSLRAISTTISFNNAKSVNQQAMQSCVLKMDELHSTLHGVAALEYLYPEFFSTDRDRPDRISALQEFQEAYLEALSTLHRNWGVTRPMAKEILVLCGRQLVDYHLCSIQNLPSEFNPEGKIELSGCPLPFALANSLFKIAFRWFNYA